jgi:hypothetical protein
VQLVIVLGFSGDVGGTETFSRKVVPQRRDRKMARQAATDPQRIGRNPPIN